MATPETDPFDVVRAEALLCGYHYRWKDEPYEVLGVEAAFETELRNPASGAASRTWRLAGRMDVVVRDLRDGHVRVIEHKTSSEDITPGSNYWKRLRLDGQVSVYFAGARALGHDVVGCVYDVLAKPGIRPLKATPPESRKYTKDGRLYAAQRLEEETPDAFRTRMAEAIASDPGAFYQRGEVVRLEAEMDEALFDVWQLGQQIRESELAKRAPRNPDNCIRFSTCPFFGVCTGEASLDDPALFKRSDLVHPELAAGAGLRLLTASRLRSARACQRLHHLRYELGYSPIEEAAALRFGTLVHQGLEAWWLSSGDARLDAALAAVNGVAVGSEAAA